MPMWYLRWVYGSVDDVIVTNGAGNFTAWPNRFLTYGRSARLLASQNGTMGFGLPAAIAAKKVLPSRTVVCFAGDGDFQMNCQELGSAMQYDAPRESLWYARRGNNEDQ